jgi:hypothetical protein
MCQRFHRLTLRCQLECRGSHEGNTGMSPGRTVGVLAGGHSPHDGPARRAGHKLDRAE